MKKLHHCKKGFVAIGMFFSVVFCAPFASSAIMMHHAEKYTYSDMQKLPNKNVALVLGAAAYPSRLSDILQDRVDTAIDLYENGKVKKIIMTGAPNEAESMAKYAIGKGVKENDIIKDIKGLNTMSSVKNSKNATEMTIVTQSFHLPRAIFLARHHGINAVGMTSDRRTYEKIFDFKKREILATSKAMMDLLLK